LTIIIELSIIVTSSKALITFCLLAKEMRKVVCFYMLFAALEAIFLVTNKNCCQGGQIKRSSSCQSRYFQNDIFNRKSAYRDSDDDG
jgi:hypothetical protein